MISHKKYLFCLWKSYFETGRGITDYVKYFIGFYALASREIWITLLLALAYAVVAFFIGKAWYKYNFQEATQEVSNQFNPFVKEMRKKLN